jgi:predicted metal-dependent hydrolase
MQLGLPFAPAGHPAPGTGTEHSAPRTSTQHSIDFVRHPRARRYVIRVRGDGTVRVTIPRGGSKKEARAFAEQQRRWIDRHRIQVAREIAQPREAIAHEHRERATRELPARLRELAEAHHLHVDRISVRDQRWRWGSCSRSGHICLNWRLVQMPPEIRDYVMIHELMHLKRMDHSSKFWKLVSHACPEYQAARRWLRGLRGLRAHGDLDPASSPDFSASTMASSV